MLILGIFCWLSGLFPGGLSYSPPKENLEARQSFQDNKFGMFIHWGPYSVLGKGEWVLEHSEMTLEEYEKRAVSKFNPENFDPSSWVSLAKKAGMKYMTVTTRHHDGFAMWEAAQDGWNIVDALPYGKDPLRALADECRRQGMKLFFYYSQADWHHPDYYPLVKTGHHTGRQGEGEFFRYLDYMDAQLRELLSDYGQVAGIWFDGMRDRPDANWRLKQTYSLIHRLQPAALIGSNHHLAPFDGEDIQMFEKDLPGEATQGFNQASTPIASLPLETCDTINDSWGYNRNDSHYKSPKELIHTLVRAAGKNANFLLNVGPRPDGTIQPECIEILNEIGKWMQKNGESLYGSRAGPIPPSSWGVSTQKGDKVYLHLLEPQETLEISLPVKTLCARLFSDGAELGVFKTKNHFTLWIPEASIDPIDTIIELEFFP